VVLYFGGALFCFVLMLFAGVVPAMVAVMVAAVLLTMVDNNSLFNFFFAISVSVWCVCY
jgi:hypothetical protein